MTHIIFDNSKEIDEETLLNEINKIPKSTKLSIFKNDVEQPLDYIVMVNNDRKIFFKAEHISNNLNISKTEKILLQLNDNQINKIEIFTKEDENLGEISLNTLLDDDELQIGEKLIDKISDTIDISDYQKNIELDVQLSIYDQEISEEKRISEIFNLLKDLNDKYTSDSKLFRDTEMFISLINDDSKEDTDTDGNKNMSYRPYLNKILHKKFSDTNIFPIVNDKKKIYDINVNFEDEEEAFKKIEFSKFFEELKITEELNLRYKNESNIGEYNLRDLISNMYKGGNLNDTFFSSINLPYLTQDIAIVSSSYYKLTIPYQTLVYRDCIFPHSCVDFKQNEKNTVFTNISTRNTERSEYFLEDQFDDMYITETRGRKKSRILSCLGTNKTGENFYYNNDKTSDFLKIQSIPPVRKNIFNGEELIMTGFYIKSPYSKTVSSFIGKEYVDENNTKYYPYIYNPNNFFEKNILKQSKEIVVIDNYEDFSYKNYDPNKDYYILFDKNKAESITEEKYVNIIAPSLLPTVNDILRFEKNNLRKCLSINDINVILHRYGIDFNELSKIALNYIDVSDNINKIISKSNYLKLKMLDKKNIYNILNEIYSILYRSITQNSEILEKDIDYCILLIDNVFNTFNNDEIIKIFCKRIINLDISGKDKKDCYLKIIEYFKKNTKVNNFLDNVSGNEKELLHKYLDNNKILLNKQNILGKMDDIALQSLLSGVKNTFYYGEELNEILQISHLKNLKIISDNDVVQKEGKLITQDLIISKEDEYIEKMKLYERNRSIYSFYLNVCNNIKIIKKYTNLSDINKDNKKEIYVDVEYDNTVILLSIYIRTLFNIDSRYNHKSQLSESEIVIYDYNIKKNISEQLPYLSNDQINVEINRLDLMIEDIDTDYYEMYGIIKSDISLDDKTRQIRSVNFKKYSKKVMSNDYAVLINNQGTFIFFRVQDRWMPAKKETVLKIENAFDIANYDKNLLSLSFEQFIDLSKESSEESEGIPKEQLCIDLKNFRMPSSLYNLYIETLTLKEQIKNYKQIIDYQNSIERKILILNTNIAKKIDRVSNANDIRYLKKTEIKPLLIRPKLSVLKEYSKIFDILDFDLRHSELFKFIDKYGQYYSRRLEKSDPKHPESSVETAKWVYYDSETVNEPICCKHYLDYKNLIFKDNSVRTEVMSKLKLKWNKGLVQGKHHICFNCGEPLDHIKYSEFEGFGGNNRVINLRETVLDSEYEDEVLINENKITEIVNFLTRMLNITLKETDYEFLKNRVFNLNTKNISWTELYNILKTDYNELYSAIYRDVKENIKEKGKSIDEQQYDEKFKEYLDLFFSTFSNEDMKNQDSQKKWKQIMKERPKDKIYMTGVLLFMKKILDKGGFKSIYKSFNLLIDIVSTLSQLLVYSLPQYRIIGTATERRHKSAYIIEDFYENRNYAYNIIIQKIYAHLKSITKLGVSKKLSKTQNMSTINKELLNFNDFINKTRFKDTGLFENLIQQKIDDINESSYMSEMIFERELHSSFDTFDFEKDEYKWKLFLPYLDIEDFNTDDDEKEFYDKIEAYKRNLDKLDSNLNKISDKEDEKEIADIKKLNSQINYENTELMTSIKNFTDLLSLKYINLINQSVLDAETKSYVSSYTSSTLFDKIESGYQDYFSKQFPIFEHIIADMDNLNKFINQYSKNYSSTNLIITEPNQTSRDLLGYMDFDNYVGLSEEKIKKNLLDKFLKVHLLYNDNRDKRIFYTVNDLDIDILEKLLVENSFLDKTNIQIKTKLREKLNEKYGEANVNEFKLNLLINHSGIGEIDITSGKYKSTLIEEFLSKYQFYSSNDIEEELDTFYQNIYLNNKIFLNSYSLSEIPFFSKEKSIKTSFEDVASCLFNLKNLDKQTIINEFSQLNPEKFEEQPQQWNSEVDTKLDDNFPIDDELSEFKKYLTPELIEKIFTNNNILNDYFDEKINEIVSQLKIENVSDSHVASEKKFRELKLLSDQELTKYNVYDNILQSLIIDYNRLKNNRFMNQEISKMSENPIKLDKNTENHLINVAIASRIDILKEAIDSIKSNPDISISFKETSIYTSIIENLVNYDFYIDLQSKIKELSLMTPSLCCKYISIFISDLLYFICITKTSLDSTDLYYSSKYIELILENLKHLIFINNISDQTINDIIKFKRAKENTYRKKSFDKMDDESKFAQKLYRRFNIAGVLYKNDDVDINVNSEEVFQGTDLAENERNTTQNNEVLLENLDALNLSPNQLDLANLEIQEDNINLMEEDNELRLSNEYLNGDEENFS